MGNIVLKSRSALTSLVYFLDLSASVTITDMFCRVSSVKVVANYVLFKTNPFGNDDSFISEPVLSIIYCP